MRPALIDTDILSRFFRQDPAIVARFAEYTRQHGVIAFSILTYYEIISGLRHRDAHRKLNAFLEFSAQCLILPLGLQACRSCGQNLRHNPQGWYSSRRHRHSHRRYCTRP